MPASSRAAPATSRRRAQVRCSTCPRRRSRDGRYPSARQSAHPARSAQHRARREGASASASPRSTRKNADYYAQRGARLPAALDAGHRALGGAGRAAQGRAGSSSSIAISAISRTGSGLTGDRRDRAEAGRAAERGLSRAARRRSSRRRPPKMILRNAYNDSKAPDWLAERVHAPVVLLPFSVGGTDGGEGSLRTLRRHREPADGGRQMSDFTANLSILWPGAARGPARRALARAAGAAGARARHRVHRSRDRAGGRPRRHRRARLRPRDRRLDDADRGRRARRSAARCCSPGRSASDRRCRRR